MVEVADEPKLQSGGGPLAVPDAGLAVVVPSIEPEVVMPLADLAQQPAGRLKPGQRLLIILPAAAPAARRRVRATGRSGSTRCRERQLQSCVRESSPRQVAMPRDDPESDRRDSPRRHGDTEEKKRVPGSGFGVWHSRRRVLPSACLCVAQPPRLCSGAAGNRTVLFRAALEHSRGGCATPPEP